MSTHAHSARRRVLELVVRYGWNATAFQALEDGYEYFFHGEACIAFVDTGGAWVAAGAPISDPETLPSVIQEFVRRAREARRRCCFFSIDARMHAALPADFDALCLGEQPVWDPRDWVRSLTSHRSLREQLRRARSKGVRVRQLSAAELEKGPLRDELESLIVRWLATRGMAPMGFLVSVEPFAFPAYRRCFVAERYGQVLGFAGVVPVPARNGWFLEDLVRDPQAPNGTNELLVDAVMRWAGGAGCEWLTLGLAPLAGEVSAWLRLARKQRFLYDFGGLFAFKAKLRPPHWAPLWLSYPRRQGALLSLIDALRAFARGSFVTFGLRSLLHGPIFLIRVLTMLLVPWTLLLALAPTDPWFGNALLKWAWVTFDVCVLGGLLRYLVKPTTNLASLLSVVVTCDTMLTSIQALVWNLPRAHTFLDYLVTFAACAAPGLAAVVLWGARQSRLRANGGRLRRAPNESYPIV